LEIYQFHYHQRVVLMNHQCLLSHLSHHLNWLNFHLLDVLQRKHQPKRDFRRRTNEIYFLFFFIFLFFFFCSGELFGKQRKKKITIHLTFLSPISDLQENSEIFQNSLRDNRSWEKIWEKIELVFFFFEKKRKRKKYLLDQNL